MTDQEAGHTWEKVNFCTNCRRFFSLRRNVLEPLGAFNIILVESTTETQPYKKNWGVRGNPLEPGR